MDPEIDSSGGGQALARKVRPLLARGGAFVSAGAWLLGCLLPDAQWRSESTDVVRQGVADAGDAVDVAGPAEAEAPSAGEPPALSPAQGRTPLQGDVPPTEPPSDAADPMLAERCAALDGVLEPGTSNCLMVVTGSPLGWEIAEIACSIREGHLASIQSAERDAFIDGLITTEVWIGASDAERDEEYVWIDGSLMTFSAWAPDEPNGGSGVDCVAKAAGGGAAGSWRDGDCSQLKAYVCERAL